MRTFVFPSSSCQHEFQNVYYLHIEQHTFQDIRIGFLTTGGLHIPFEESTYHTKVVLHSFRSHSSLERLVVSRYRRYAAELSRGRNCDRHDEPGIHHSMEQA